MILEFFNNLEKNNSKDLEIFRDGDTFTVDRFENDFAVLESRKTGKMFNVSIFKLPNNLKEGDILSVINGSFVLNDEKTNNVQQDIQSKFDKLKKK